MDKLKKKQMALLKKIQEQTEIQYKRILNEIINGDEQLQLSLTYSYEYFNSLFDENNTTPFPNLSQYTSSIISKIVFTPQLQRIKQRFQELPNKQCKLQHFLIIMVQILFLNPTLQDIQIRKKSKDENITKRFEKIPLFLIALKQMFRQMANQNRGFINFQKVQKFVLGEIVYMNNAIQNTQFQIRYQQLKKQDFLLHQNGIKQLLYSNQLKVYLCLDYKSSEIKIYNADMKSRIKFVPDKLKHNRRSPEILDMSYTEFHHQIGLVLSDKTVTIVALDNFLNKNEEQFNSSIQNEMIHKFQSNVKKVCYLEMANKWLVITEKNYISLLDVSKVKYKNQQIIITHVKNENHDLQITKILQVVNLSLTCFVAGNQVWFYNETLTKRKNKNFSHSQTITNFIYSEQKDLFYLSGKEKIITTLSLYKNKPGFQVNSFKVGRLIQAFQIFPHFGTICILDNQYNLRLMDQVTKTFFQEVSYKRIAKKQEENIKILKTSREEFMIYESYMISLHQEKIAIQKQVQFEFLPTFYYNQQTQDIQLSFNSQIVKINLLQAQIRRTININNSNLTSHQFFALDHTGKVFVLDDKKQIFEVHLKDQSKVIQSKSYKRKLQLNDVIFTTYDFQQKKTIILTSTQLYQIVNDQCNSFPIRSIGTLDDEQHIRITHASYNSKIKTLFISTILKKQKTTQTDKKSKKNLNDSRHSIPQFETHQVIYPISIIDYTFLTPIEYVFQKLQSHQKNKILIQHEYFDDWNLDILLTDQNVIYFVSRSQKNNLIFVQSQNYVCLKLYHFLPPQLRDNFKFNSFILNKVEDNQQKSVSHYYLIVLNQHGFMLEMNLKNLLQKNFKKNKNDFFKPRYSLKQAYQMDLTKMTFQECCLSTKQHYAIQDKQQAKFIKAHEDRIIIAKKVMIQFIFTLTISNDGFIKLWNEPKQCILSVKLPNMRRQIYNVRPILEIRSKKTAKKIIQVLKSLTKEIKRKQNIQTILQITRDHRYQKNYSPINTQMPIKIQFENKDIQNIVVQQPKYVTLSPRHSNSNSKKLLNTQDQEKQAKIHFRQLKKQRSFQNILEKSVIKPKKSIQVPKQIYDLRKPFRKYEKYEAKILKIHAPKQQLVILPQIKQYQPEYLILPGFSTEREKKLKRYDENQQEVEYDNNFESVAFVKNKMNRKRVNQLDKIDKQFHKKTLELLSKKKIFKYDKKSKDKRNLSISEKKKQSQDIQQQKKSIELILKQFKAMKSGQEGFAKMPKVIFSKGY